MFNAYIHFNRGPANRVKYNLLPALHKRMASNIPDPMADWDFTVAPAGGAAGGEAGGGPAVVVVAERGPAAEEAAAVGGPPVVVAAEAPAVVGAVDGGVDGVVLPGP